MLLKMLVALAMLAQAKKAVLGTVCSFRVAAGVVFTRGCASPASHAEDSMEGKRQWTQDLGLQ